MRARQVQSRFWDDEFVVEATWQSRYVFMYLLTCPAINMSGIFQISDKKIAFETGLSDEDVMIAKEELSEHKKVLFHEGWIYIVNAFKNCKVWKSPMCWDAWEEEWSKVSQAIREHFNTTMDIDIYTTQKQEIDKEQLRPRKKRQSFEEKKLVQSKTLDEELGGL